jgi:hypothetical protein
MLFKWMNEYYWKNIHRVFQRLRRNFLLFLLIFLASYIVAIINLSLRVDSFDGQCEPSSGGRISSPEDVMITNMLLC